MLARLSLAAIALLHLVFAVVLLSLLMALPDRSLVITMRRQFDDWTPLIRAYRSAEACPAPETMRAEILALAWCNVTLPPLAVRAPYCDCVSHQHTLYANAVANASVPIPSALRESAVRGLVRCLAARPVWRVWPVWAVNPVTPALYILLVTAAFAWVAADIWYASTRWGLWSVSLAFVIALLQHSLHENCLWVITIPMVALLIEFVALPGMIDRDFIECRLKGCFWWCEYVCAPVFSLFVPLMHCGRDILCLLVTVALGSTLGALGLRSFWTTSACAKSVFYRDIQLLTGVTVILVSLALLALSCVYFNWDTPFIMGRGSVVLLSLTTALPLLQCVPMGEDNRFAFQLAVAVARNVMLFAFTAADTK
jgi:hypothetical protein